MLNITYNFVLPHLIYKITIILEDFSLELLFGVAIIIRRHLIWLFLIKKRNAWWCKSVTESPVNWCQYYLSMVSQFYWSESSSRNLGNVPNYLSRILDTNIKGKDMCWQKTYSHMLPAKATIQCLSTNPDHQEGWVPIGHVWHWLLWVWAYLLNNFM